MVDQLRSFAAEVTRVAREVGTEGKLGGQADVQGVAGTWKDLTDSVNFMARFVLSQSCSVFLRVVSRRLRIISLVVSLSAATSPRASTVMERVRSPCVTAVATSAMARTCVVRFAAS